MQGVEPFIYLALLRPPSYKFLTWRKTRKRKLVCLYYIRRVYIYIYIYIALTLYQNKKTSRNMEKIALRTLTADFISEAAVKRDRERQ